MWVLSTVKIYAATFISVADRQQIAHSMESFAFFLGPPHRLETIAGFTQWRLLVVAAILGAIWGILTSTGLLRGEEDAGRWELLVAGPTTRRRATLEALLGLAALIGLMLLPLTVLTVVAAQTPGARFGVAGVLLFDVALVAGAAMFLAVGAVASQIAATRSQAAILAATVLGLAFIARVVSDTGNSLEWVRWLSPIGWLEELRPLKDPQPIALVPIVGWIVAGGALTLRLAEQRDVGTGSLAESGSAVGRNSWLRGPTTLAWQVTRGSATAWLAAFAGFGLLYGSVARSSAEMLASFSSMTTVLARLGLQRAIEGYVGAIFFMFAAILAAFAASQIAAIRDEESSGRLDNLLVQPVHRVHWLLGRLAVSLTWVVIAGVVSGLFIWLGLARQHTGLDLPELIGAGLNATLPAVAVIGLGAAALGLLPRAAPAFGYGLVAWSFLVDLLGALLRGNEWLRGSSLFAHIALVPAANPAWGDAAGLLAVTSLGLGLGVWGFLRRDLEYA
jgi:ABC-2 type transport system permease protein